MIAMKNNGKLWDAIGEYAETHHEFMSSRPSNPKHMDETYKAHEKARADLIAIIGKRDDPPEKIGGQYDPADYA